MPLDVELSDREPERGVRGAEHAEPPRRRLGRPAEPRGEGVALVGERGGQIG